MKIVNLYRLGGILLPLLFAGCSTMSASDYLKEAYNFEKEKKYSEAFKMFTEADNLKNVDARGNIGRYYCSGLGGIPKDTSKGFTYQLEAAQKENLKFQVSVAELFRLGNSCKPKDLALAKFWYEKALKHPQINAKMYDDEKQLAENGLKLVIQELTPPAPPKPRPRPIRFIPHPPKQQPIHTPKPQPPRPPIHTTPSSCQPPLCTKQ